jgi:hypothetical protein
MSAGREHLVINEMKMALGLIVVCTALLLATPNVMQGQQSASSAHFGAGASSSTSTPGANAAGGSTGAGGGSTWGAGGGSFGYSTARGGVWRDGTILGTTQGAGPGTTQSNTPSADVLSSAGALPSAAFSARPTSIRGNAAAGTAHLSRSSPYRNFGTMTSSSGYALQPFGKRHVAVGSRGRVTSMGRASGRGGNRPSASLASPMGKHPQRTGTVAGSSLRSGLNTRLNAQGSEPLP